MPTALMVVDVQNDVVAGVASAADTIRTIALLVTRARTIGVPIVWVQHDEPGLQHGTYGWQLVPELVPEPGDIRIDKHHRSSFAGTGLADQLRALGVTHIVLTGAQSAFCVDMAGKHALVDGFDVTLVSDGHCNGTLDTDDGPLTDAQVRALINRTWSTLHHPGADVKVLPAAEVSL